MTFESHYKAQGEKERVEKKSFVCVGIRGACILQRFLRRKLMKHTSQKGKWVFSALKGDKHSECERGSTFHCERGSTFHSERGSTFHSERGSTVIEYVLGIALLFPVALGIGLSLEKVSQSRGQVALEASQYLLPCTSSNSPLGEDDPNECK
ncbi:hypothetical protein EBR25_11640 [bacterium]|nr:hypothetical protein [bacterium]